MQIRHRLHQHSQAAKVSKNGFVLVAQLFKLVNSNNPRTHNNGRAALA